MEQQFCQSCGMPLGDPGTYATNADESRNEDYCIYCYAFGDFTEEVTMDEMIEQNLGYMEEYHAAYGQEFQREETEKRLREFFPTLKRWSGK